MERPPSGFHRRVDNLRHLAWIPAGAAVGFVAAFAFGDRPALPVDLYYLLYFGAVIGFGALYVKRTALDLRRFVRPRLWWAVALGLLVGWIMVRQVLARPATEQLSGGMLVWAIAWRGVAYGAVDGILLFAFPWIVTWRALGAGSAGLRRKLLAVAFAWPLILFVTTVYHLGYADFRSPKLLQPNFGSAITAVPTLLSANPVASPISHVMLHVAAVIHSPDSELFLPPHRSAAPPDAPQRPPGGRSQGRSAAGAPRADPVRAGDGRSGHRPRSGLRAHGVGARIAFRLRVLSGPRDRRGPADQPARIP